MKAPTSVYELPSQGLCASKWYSCAALIRQALDRFRAPFLRPVDSKGRNCSYGSVGRDALSIITVIGSVSIDTVQGLRALLAQRILQRQHIILCMADVRHIDTAGVAVLLEAYAAAQTRQLEFVLLDISICVRRLLYAHHLDEVFPVYDCLSGAEQYIAQQVNTPGNRQLR